MFKDVLFGENVPAPPDQTPPVASVTVPESDTAGLFSQTLWFAPAFAVGAGPKVTTIESTSG